MTRAVKGKTMWDSENIDTRHEAALRLFEALSGVDEEYLAACEEDKGGGAADSRMLRFVWKYGKAMAAALCVAVLGISYMSFRLGVFPGVMNKDSSGGMTMDMAAPAADEALAEASEEAAETPAEAVSTEYEASVEETMEAAYDEQVGTAGEINGTENGDAADSGGMDAKKKELAEGEKSPESVQGSGQGAQEGISDRDSTVTESVGSLRDERTEMTLAEAEALAVVGAYLPTATAWPGDGKLESVRGSDRKGAESVALTWQYSNALDSFFVTVTNLGNVLPRWVNDALADVSKPETYDRRQYEVPYADTVPEEYRMIFQDTIFRAEDFSRECVEARILSGAGDSGDTDTPRGNFRVLYRTDEGNYVLVGFSGKGSVEEIWYLMRSIDYFSHYEEWQKPPAP